MNADRTCNRLRVESLEAQCWEHAVGRAYTAICTVYRTRPRLFQYGARRHLTRDLPSLARRLPFVTSLPSIPRFFRLLAGTRCSIPAAPPLPTHFQLYIFPLPPPFRSRFAFLIKLRLNLEILKFKFNFFHPLAVTHDVPLWYYAEDKLFIEHIRLYRYR